MKSADVLTRLNSVRVCFNDALEKLDNSASFTALCRNSNKLAAAHRDIVSKVPARVRAVFVGKFVCAIVGSSGHGKTTIVDEMFPELSKRGWLVTDVTDTTSQSLRIEYAPQGSEELNEVTVNSWTIGQIKGLFNEEGVTEQNAKDNVQVTYHDDSIEVDGSEATFKREDMAQFRFPLKQRVEPFPVSYGIPADKMRDAAFIRALTTKEQSSRLTTDPIITVDGHSYDSLQCRAVVKDVCLRDDFRRIQQWGGLSGEALERLAFVDTPGIAVKGMVKDEVLRHPLEVKSNQIVLELLKNDELDILVHLVLCGRQSDFSVLWKALERECGTIGMEDLSERLILAFNGTNMLFTNPDIREHIKTGEHFEIVLEDNILQKMSPRGRMKPACVCFVDSKRIVEGSGSDDDYETQYQRHGQTMATWLKPGGKAYKYLKQHGLLDSFAENAKALCNADDRGQGFLVRQIAGLISRKGNLLLVKKYLIRTGLLNLCKQLFDILSKYYDEEGQVSCHATQDAIQKIVSCLDKDDLHSIETFCADHVDGELDGIIRDSSKHNSKWVCQSFMAGCTHAFEQLADKSDADAEAARVFKEHCASLAENWAHMWGYAEAELPSPEEDRGRAAALVAHSIRTHVREVLYQLLTSESLFGSMRAFEQTDEDKETIRAVIEALGAAVQKGKHMCNQLGIAL